MKRSGFTRRRAAMCARRARINRRDTAKRRQHRERLQEARAERRELTDARLARVAEINHRLWQLRPANHGATEGAAKECVQLASERACLLGLGGGGERGEG